MAKAQAEQAEIARLAQIAAQQEKRRQRLRLGSWLLIAGLTLVGIAWLLYAPFFLAFAFEMGWVSEETRNRMDPAASMRSALASKTIEPVKKAVPMLSESQPEDPNAVKYTFYGELPKDVVLTGVQPLAVKTKAPMYLQLLSLPNEAQAQSERRRLVQKGYAVQMATLVGKSGKNYVLRMGPYDDQRTLNRLRAELQKLGIDAREVSLASVVKASEPAKRTNAKTAPLKPPANNTRGAVVTR
ncbi:MAG: SPOR domain-containing protein [Gammaproteobacteria bacterium]|nr:SPOR domain-containing protein [Gammaproteobacteria bacterium]